VLSGLKEQCPACGGKGSMSDGETCPICKGTAKRQIPGARLLTEKMRLTVE